MFEWIETRLNKAWRWFLVVVLGLGIAMAAGVNKIEDIEEPLRLKADKEKILNYQIEKNGEVKYAFITDEIVPDLPDEIVSQRTYNTRYFSMPDNKIKMTISVGAPFYKENNEWKYVHLATTTREAFELQTVSLLERLITKAIAFTSQVASSDDDTYCASDETGGEDNTAETSLLVGEHPTTDAYTFDSSVRFLTITVPNAAVISDGTHLSFKEVDNQLGEWHFKIKGEDVDDAATFGACSNFVSRQATTTTAQIDWDGTGFTADTWYDTPEIKTIVKEIVDRGSWASGNDMAFFVEDDGSVSEWLHPYAYDYAGNEFGAILTIVYVGEPSGESPEVKSQVIIVDD